MQLRGGVIGDDLRIRLPIDTPVWLLDEGANKLTVCSHLGRPKGKPDSRYSIAPFRQRLYELLEVGPDVPDNWMGLDIGPMTRDIFADIIADAATVFWNGPMGCVRGPPLRRWHAN